VDPRRLRIGEWLTGLGGVVLLGSTFLSWYDVPGGGVSAWHAFTVVDLLLALVAALALGAAAMAAAHNTPAASLALASLTALVGLFAVVAVVVRLLSPSVDDAGLAVGAWVGLASCVLTTLGAFAAMRDQRFPRAARIEVPVEAIPPPEGGNA
jgi:hypothetical protein